MSLMHEISIVAIWVMILSVMLTVLMLVRKEISQMLKMQAGTKGLAVGEQFPRNMIRDSNGQLVDIFHPRLKGSLLIFTALSCGACKSVYPFLTRYQEKHPELLVATFTVGEKENILTLIDEYNLKIPVIPLKQGENAQFGVDMIPFAYFVTPDGRIASKGMANFEQHLDALVGTAQFTAYMKVAH